VEPDFGILGRTALLIDGSLREDWGTRRERAVLTALLVHAGRLVPIDTLTEWVWPEGDPDLRNPVSTIHTYATRIRKWLQRLPTSPDLFAGAGGCRLEVDESLIDYHRFRAMIREAREHIRGHRPLDAAGIAERALRLWRGPPLEELHSELARAWRARVVHDEWLPAQGLLVEALLELGQFDEAIARLDDIHLDYGNDVTMAMFRLSALHGQARFSDAAAFYGNARRRLRDEGDDLAADHLRRHYERLRDGVSKASTTVPPEPVAPPRQLPHDIVDFVGRNVHLAAMDAAVTTNSNGVVILDGMPGVGKTALAIRWGYHARARFPDGDLFVNLHGFSDTARVAQSTVVDDFLTALGHPPDKDLSPRSRELMLSRLLTGRRTLVVLDNARDSEHVKDLVALLSSSVVVVTSRQRMTKLSAATGARRVWVEPLPPNEATELMSVRLRMRHPMARDDQARMASLCGGLPLMITVLAEHIVTRSAAQATEFAQQLDRQQLVFDVGEDGDGPTNAQAFFGWSYRALAEPERRLFRLLALHPGPDISLSAAAACYGRATQETKRSLAMLAGAHLLEQASALDRHQLHDLIREFARHCAESDETAAGRRAAEIRLLSFYLRSAAQADRLLYPHRLPPPELPLTEPVEPVTFTSKTPATSWLGHERANLVALVRFAAERGHHAFAWRLADTVAPFLDRHGYFEDSRVVRELAVSSARAVDDRDAIGSSLVGLGMTGLTLGDHELAQRCFDEGLRHAVEDRNERGQTAALHHLGRLAMARGDTITAIDLYRRCLELTQRIGDDIGQCWMHCRLGAALRLQEQHEQALIHLHTAQWLATRAGTDMAHATSLAEIALVYRDLDDVHAAIAHGEQALAVAEAIPDLASTAQVCIALAEINGERGDPAVAVSYARRAAEVARRTHHAAEARAREVLGDLAHKQGDLADAVQAWQHAAALYDRLGNTARVALVRAKLADVPQGDLDLPAARRDTPPPDTRTRDTRSDVDEHGTSS
jgi:tetratricopeptide (TPR) repeat protein